MIYIKFALPDLLGNGVAYILDIKIYFPRYLVLFLSFQISTYIKIKFLLAKLLLKQNLYEEFDFMWTQSIFT